MPHLTNALLIVSGIGLSLSIFLAVRALFENRRGEAAPFRRYFKFNYLQSPLRQGSSNDERNSSDRRSRFAAVDVRDPSAAQYSIGGAIQQSRGQE